MSDGARPISARYREVPDRLRLRASNERPRRFSAPCWFGCAGQPKGRPDRRGTRRFDCSGCSWNSRKSVFIQPFWIKKLPLFNAGLISQKCLADTILINYGSSSFCCVLFQSSKVIQRSRGFFPVWCGINKPPPLGNQDWKLMCSALTFGASYQNNTWVVKTNKQNTPTTKSDARLWEI